MFHDRAEFAYFGWKNADVSRIQAVCYAYLFEPATLEINAIWRMQYFIWYCLNTTVCEFNIFNIGTVKEFKRNLSSCTKWASKLKVHFNAITASLLLLQLPFPCNPAFISTWDKSYEDIYPSPPRVSFLQEISK